MNRLNFNVVYIPFSWSGNSPKISSKKIITIHDLRPMRELHSVGTNSRLFHILRINKVILRIFKKIYLKQIKNAERVITISNYVKNDVLKEWPDVSEDKLITIYNSISLSEYAVPPMIKLNKPFILYVNTLNSYKNVGTLMRAYKNIFDEIPHNLVIVGKETAYWEECKVQIVSSDLSKRIIHIRYCSDEELRWLYEHAALFVTTSTREGFGYTPIEAAVCGCPVISTLSESLGEVTDGLLNYYYPPTNVEMLGQLIKQILLKPIQQEDLFKISSHFRYKYSTHLQVRKIIELLQSYA